MSFLDWKIFYLKRQNQLIKGDNMTQLLVFITLLLTSLSSFAHHENTLGDKGGHMSHSEWLLVFAVVIVIGAIFRFIRKELFSKNKD